MTRDLLKIAVAVPACFALGLFLGWLLAVLTFAH